MILDEAYRFLKSASLVRNHAVFSTEYLGHSPRYYDYLRCSGAQPSLRSLLKVAIILNDFAAVAPCPTQQSAAVLLAQRMMTGALKRCR